MQDLGGVKRGRTLADSPSPGAGITTGEPHERGRRVGTSQSTFHFASVAISRLRAQPARARGSSGSQNGQFRSQLRVSARRV